MYRNLLWTEKYRPTNLDDYVFHTTEHKNIVSSIVDAKIMPNLLLYGLRGSGKSTLARLIPKLLDLDDADVLTINASKNRGIDEVRDSIYTFCSTSPLSTFKCVYFEEADELTLSAQKALKDIIESSASHVRFMFVCNDVSKIIEPIRSRLQELEFKHVNESDRFEIARNILRAENITFELPDVLTLVEQHGSDIRKLINQLQQQSTTGTLIPRVSGITTTNIIEAILMGNWLVCRDIITSYTDSDWNLVYDMMYHADTLESIPPNAHEPWILAVADHAHKNQTSGNKHLNCLALCIELIQILRSVK